MTREAQVLHGEKTVYVSKALLDTGAQESNYAGRSLVERFDDLVIEPCSHWVRLGDGATKVHLTEMVTLEVAIYDDEGTLLKPISTQFYVMPTVSTHLYDEESPIH